MRWAAALALLATACATAAKSPLPPRIEPSANEAAREAPSLPRMPEGTSRPPTPAEQSLIRELMRETENLRALRFREPFAIRIQDAAAIRGYVRGALQDDELERARVRYLALGLIEPALDVRELIESLMEEELIGYYDPKDKVLTLRDDVAASLTRDGQGTTAEQWRATVVHELVHALQDQHLGLSASLHGQRTTDEENAFGAVVEGDATLAMLGYMATRQGSSLEAVVASPQQLRTALHADQGRVTGRLARAPALVREPLLFRYREGAVFSARVYRKGGWDLLNKAHQAPPRTTHGVIFGDQLQHRPAPQLLAPPTLKEQGCAARDDDSLGALEVAAALLPDEPQELLASWRGDRYVVLRCPSATGSVWLLSLSTPAAARRAKEAIEELDASARLPVSRIMLLRGRFLLAARGVPAAAQPVLVEFLGRVAEPDAPLVDD